MAPAILSSVCCGTANIGTLDATPKNSTASKPRSQTSKAANLRELEAEVAEHQKVEKARCSKIAHRRFVHEVSTRHSKQPRLVGWLVECCPGLIFGDSNKLRWVILDHEMGTMSIWQNPPELDLAQAEKLLERLSHDLFYFDTLRTSKSALKTFKLENLAKVEANKKWKNIFLQFDGARKVTCLTPELEEDFEIWVDALQQYTFDDKRGG